jgi:hypothetical protein
VEMDVVRLYRLDVAAAIAPTILGLQYSLMRSNF